MQRFGTHAQIRGLLRRALAVPVAMGALMLCLGGSFAPGQTLNISATPPGPDMRAARVATAPVVVQREADVAAAVQQPGTNQILTLVPFTVSKIERGSVPTAITVEVAGGSANGVTMFTSAANELPAFRAHGRYRLSLEPLSDGNYQVVEGKRGKQDDPSAPGEGPAKPAPDGQQTFSAGGQTHTAALSAVCGNPYCWAGYTIKSHTAVYKVNGDTSLPNAGAAMWNNDA